MKKRVHVIVAQFLYDLSVNLPLCVSSGRVPSLSEETNGAQFLCDLRDHLALCGVSDRVRLCSRIAALFKIFSVKFPVRDVPHTPSPNVKVTKLKLSVVYLLSQATHCLNLTQVLLNSPCKLVVPFLVVVIALSQLKLYRSLSETYLANGVEFHKLNNCAFSCLRRHTVSTLYRP